MKSIQSKLTLVISAIIIVVIGALLIISTTNTNAILDDDSQEILSSVAEYYANIIDDNFRSTEQSVGTMFNYANKRAETYTAFLEDEQERDAYTYDISELGKSIAENTRGAMAVYLRYNPVEYGPISGFWYTINLEDNSWQPSVPTDMSLYEPDDLEHVGWYYIPVAAGQAMWMDPYYNANLGVDMISYIIPYFYKGDTVGIIGMDINMELLKESVAKVSVYDTGRAFLIDKKGNLIYHDDFPEGMEFEKLSQRDQDYFQSILQLKLNTPDLFLSRYGEQQKLILKELKNGMLLGLYVPLDEINAPQRNLLTLQLLTSVVILALAIFLGLVWVRTITGPLKKMTSVAEHYAGGNFSEKMRMEGRDEIGILSRSLQAMSTSLQEQIRIADTANKAKSAFLANMSHEIRTPINAILGMNEMILRESKEAPIQEYASNIENAGKTLLSLVNSILDFSKIEDGKMEIIPANYDTASLINNLVNSVTERAKAKSLDFRVDVDETLPSVLQGDDIRITQVILNLLSNAVKYTEQGGITLTMQDVGRGDGMIDILVSVQDTGIGIKQEDMGKLFESFERIDEKRNRNIEGTGLGMSIVLRLLNMMGSELNVESVYGEGSVFSFTLRQRIIDEEPIGNYSERLMRSAARIERKACLLAPDAKVLVVDDNEMNLKVAKNLLKLNGIIPDLVDSGAEAIRMMREKDYHIVFLDHMMPGMDGIETLHELRRLNLAKSGTVIIALTANAIVGAKETYLQEGFDGYLSKPIEIPQLEELLIRCLPSELCTLTQVCAETLNRQQKDDILSVLEATGIHTAKGLGHAAGDQAFYLELLKDFAAGAAEKAAKIRADAQAGDSHSYQIRVHTLKGAARMIGATELADLAMAQENAAKNGDAAAIDSGVEPLLESYCKTAAEIAEALGITDDDSPAPPQGAIDMEPLRAELVEIAQNLEIFEIGRAEAALKRLSGLTWHGESLEDTLRPVRAAVDSFELEQAKQLLDGIIQRLDRA